MKKESIYIFICPICGGTISLNKKDAKEYIHKNRKCKKVGNKRNYEKGLYK